MLSSSAGGSKIVAEHAESLIERPGALDDVLQSLEGLRVHGER
jgi:hypothetical protein